VQHLLIGGVRRRGRAPVLADQRLDRRAVDDVDSRRISYIAQCFSSLGFSLVEARHRAFLLYAYEVAESILFWQGNDAQKRERSALMQRLLLSRVENQ